MGRPKLLLELGGKTVIARVVEALRQGGCDEVWLLARWEDVGLHAAVRDLSLRVVLTDGATADMRASVELLLRGIAETAGPQGGDGWLLCPADHPVLRPELVQTIIDRWRERPDSIVVPHCGGRRGHPTLFPWPLAARLEEIPVDQGLNWLLGRKDIAVEEVVSEDPTMLQDLDTPADYERLRDHFEAAAGPV